MWKTRALFVLLALCHPAVSSTACRGGLGYFSDYDTEQAYQTPLSTSSSQCSGGTLYGPKFLVPIKFPAVPYTITEFCMPVYFGQAGTDIEVTVALYNFPEGSTMLPYAIPFANATGKITTVMGYGWTTVDLKDNPLTVYKHLTGVGVYFTTCVATYFLYSSRNTGIMIPTVVGKSNVSSWTGWANLQGGSLARSHTGLSLRVNGTASAVYPNWNCSAALFNDGTECNCECGEWDPDCDLTNVTSTCSDSQFCSPLSAVCKTIDWPSSCATKKNYAALDYCDCCEGTLYDPDCLLPGQWMCAGGQPGQCKGNGQCSTDTITWACSASKYGDGICDCECGGTSGYALSDIDCYNDSNPSTCSTGSICIRNAYCMSNSWSCKLARYADGTKCDCGCTAVDKDCESLTITSSTCTNGTVCNSKAVCVAGGCGNGVVESTEQCEPGETGCSSGCSCGTGFYPNSTTYLKGCFSLCSDGITASTEECDGGDLCSNCKCPNGTTTDNANGCKCPESGFSYKDGICVKKSSSSSNSGAIIGGVVGGVGGAAVLAAVIIGGVMMKRKQSDPLPFIESGRPKSMQLAPILAGTISGSSQGTNALGATGPSFTASATLPVPIKVAEVDFAAEGSSLIDAGAKWEVSTDELFFVGNRGEQVTVERQMQYSFQITSHFLKAKAAFKLFPTSNYKYTLTYEPSDGVLKHDESVSVTATLILHCTTNIKAQVPVMVAFVTEGEPFKQHKMLNFEVIGKLSTRLDFDEIQLANKVGEGSFGIVFRGRWRGNDVAVKKLKSQMLALDQSALADFIREVDNMESLRSPHIVNFYGAVLQPDNVCMVTEFCEMGSLGSVMKSVNLDTDLRIKYILDSARGMNYLHQSNILHRDFKPDNVLVVSQSIYSPVACKLTDFGTSCTMTSKKKELNMTKGVGTPAYMAPEVIRSENYSKAADVFSFAMMLWEIWAETAPYSSGEFKSLFDVSEYVISGKRLPIPDKSPKWCAELTVRCWALLPEDRPNFEVVVSEIEKNWVDPTKTSNNLMTTAPVQQNTGLTAPEIHHPKKKRSHRGVHETSPGERHTAKPKDKRVFASGNGKIEEGVINASAKEPLAHAKSGDEEKTDDYY